MVLNKTERVGEAYREEAQKKLTACLTSAVSVSFGGR